MNKSKIELHNRYGVKHRLVPCSCDENRYKYESDDKSACNRFGLADDSSDVNYFDPSGGPMMTVGGQIPGVNESPYIAYIKCDEGNVFVYTADNADEAEKIRELMSSKTETCGSCSCVELSIDASEVSDAPSIKSRVVIGMIGKAGSGKDTVADYIVDKYGFQKLAFADPLKKAVQTIFDIDDEYMFDREKREETLPGWEPWSTRKLLQFVGTELMRNQVDENVWVKNAVSRVARIPLAIISDVRFPNEVDDVRTLLDGQAHVVFIRVARPDHEGAQGGLQNHASESHIGDLNADFDITNGGTLEELYATVDDLMKLVLESGE